MRFRDDRGVNTLLARRFGFDPRVDSISRAKSEQLAEELASWLFDSGPEPVARSLPACSAMRRVISVEIYWRYDNAPRLPRCRARFIERDSLSSGWNRAPSERWLSSRRRRWSNVSHRIRHPHVSWRFLSFFFSLSFSPSFSLNIYIHTYFYHFLLFLLIAIVRVSSTVQ